MFALFRANLLRLSSTAKVLSSQEVYLQKRSPPISFNSTRSLKMDIPIRIEENERVVFDVLVKAAESLEAERKGEKIRMFVAGGWVRDKILDRSSIDIDVLVSNCHFLDFACRAKEISTTVEEKILKDSVKTPTDGPRKASKTKIGVIKANTSAGKQISASVIHICGFDIDILNPRVLPPDSLCSDQLLTCDDPIEVDVHLRDFTINSLLFNIRSSQIEDHANGFKDLQSSILRCSKEGGGALGRLKDDPLRCLRAVRMAARFDLVLDPELQETIKHNIEIRDALFLKTSKERIVLEMDKIFTGSQLQYACELLHECELTQLLILPISSSEKIQSDRSFLFLAKKAIENRHLFSDDSLRIGLLVCQFLPFFLHSPNSFEKEAVVEGLKRSKNDANQIVDLMIWSKRLSELCKAFICRDENLSLQLQAGKLLRETGEKTEQVFFFAQLIDVISKSASDLEEPQTVIQNDYRELRSYLTSVSLMGEEPIWKVPLFFTGKNLVTDFHLRPGKHIGEIIEQITEWQIMNLGRSKEECEGWLLQTIHQRSDLH